MTSVIIWPFFYCRMSDEQQALCIQENELLEAKWLYPKELAQDEMTSVMLREMVFNQFEKHRLDAIEGINPGDVFGYSSYKLFFKK